MCVFICYYVIMVIFYVIIIYMKYYIFMHLLYIYIYELMEVAFVCSVKSCHCTLHYVNCHQSLSKTDSTLHTAMFVVVFLFF